MRSLVGAFMVLIASAIMPSCSEEHREVIDGEVDYEVTPTMKTVNVSTLISDSGIIRYHIVSPLWLMYEEAKRPVWTFPKGLTLERYDDFFNKNATITCDSASYAKQEGLWELDRNVKVTNTLGERFLTDLLFWNEKSHRVYSDAFIHIERADRIIEGYGFTANDRMTQYEIRNVSGIFPVDELRAGATDADTTTTAEPKSYPGDQDSSNTNQEQS
ncbi:MAG: LPS export ABC transporter periplasmic protein LptC [Muribaculaceae bacterium]|nr:LPS export ABC transporter periplasmic protein LptC [Muribaculaceae bacterium]